MHKFVRVLDNPQLHMKIIRYYYYYYCYCISVLISKQKKIKFVIGLNLRDGYSSLALILRLHVCLFMK